ncbi:MAG: hypothetical protein WCP73_09895, partial [Eubacteriales bacterium]
MALSNKDFLKMYLPQVNKTGMPTVTPPTVVLPATGKTLPTVQQVQAMNIPKPVNYTTQSANKNIQYNAPQKSTPAAPAVKKAPAPNITNPASMLKLKGQAGGALTKSPNVMQTNFGQPFKIVMSNLPRMRELSAKPLLNDAEKLEAEKYLQDYDKVNTLTQGTYLPGQESAYKELHQLASDLDVKARPAVAGMAGAFSGIVPFGEYIAPDEFAAAKANNPEAYGIGETAGTIGSLFTGGAAIKGGMDAAKLAPKLIKAGVNAKFVPFITGAIENQALGAMQTGMDATKPGYDVNNLGTDLLRNGIFYGVAGATNKLFGEGLQKGISMLGLNSSIPLKVAKNAVAGFGSAAAGVGATLPT